MLEHLTRPVVIAWEPELITLLSRNGQVSALTLWLWAIASWPQMVNIDGPTIGVGTQGVERLNLSLFPNSWSKPIFGLQQGR